MQIPGNFILMLSGVPCVGKTTTAYNILKYQPEFRRVSELDIVRTIVRATIRNIENPESHRNSSPIPAADHFQ